jgi:hypothetical protein
MIRWNECFVDGTLCQLKKGAAVGKTNRAKGNKAHGTG